MCMPATRSVCLHWWSARDKMKTLSHLLILFKTDGDTPQIGAGVVFIHPKNIDKIGIIIPYVSRVSHYLLNYK